MGAVTLADIRLTPLKRIQTPGGEVMHAMQEQSAGFAGFGEAYFSVVECGAIKAWKQHTRMTCNLVVPHGSVRFVCTADDETGSYVEHVLGPEAYARLTIPPGLWFGFQGLAPSGSIVLNIANLAHDPMEVVRKDVQEISFDWEASGTSSCRG